MKKHKDQKVLKMFVHKTGIVKKFRFALNRMKFEAILNSKWHISKYVILGSIVYRNRVKSTIYRVFSVAWFRY